MKHTPALRRWLVLGVSLAVFALAVAWSFSLRHAVAPPLQADAPSAGRSWAMWGGTNQRNLVNLLEHDIPTTWSIQKNVKWSAALGTKAYGGPIVHRGKIFIGTNNHLPRNPDIKG